MYTVAEVYEHVLIFIVILIVWLDMLGRMVSPCPPPPPPAIFCMLAHFADVTVCVCLMLWMLKFCSIIGLLLRCQESWRSSPSTTLYPFTDLNKLLDNWFFILMSEAYSSGAVWESRWPSWAVHPNEPSGFRGHKAILNRASASVTAGP